jgi:prepilin-type N-terminal cleavage/methylation domain-containing protein
VNKRRRIAFIGFRSALSNERGMNLIEVLVALGILAAVAVTFLLGMSTSSKAVVTNQEQIAAEDIAKSQMESVQRQTYDADHNPPQYAKLDPADLPAVSGYTVDDIQITAVRMDPNGDGTANDDGLQKITVTIYRGTRVVFSLEGYKCFTGG